MFKNLSPPASTWLHLLSPSSTCLHLLSLASTCLAGEFRSTLEHTDVNKFVPFDFNCDFIKMHFGTKRDRPISYQEFTQVLWVSRYAHSMTWTLYSAGRWRRSSTLHTFLFSCLGVPSGARSAGFQKVRQQQRWHRISAWPEEDPCEPVPSPPLYLCGSQHTSGEGIPFTTLTLIASSAGQINNRCILFSRSISLENVYARSHLCSRRELCGKTLN